MSQRPEFVEYLAIFLSYYDRQVLDFNIPEHKSDSDRMDVLWYLLTTEEQTAIYRMHFLRVPKLEFNSNSAKA